MRQYGLIGKSLSHSFSKAYFEEKFRQKGLGGHVYDLFELPDIGMLPDFIVSKPELCGFNVTIPFKRSIIPFLDELSPEAAAIGAVNVVERVHGVHEVKGVHGVKGVKGVNEVKGVKGVNEVNGVQRVKGENGVWLKGYNTDAEGFAMSLEGVELPGRALVLGTGGAASAVGFVLRQRGIPFLQVSRAPGQGDLTYAEVTGQILRDYPLVVNCTPVGTLGEPQRLLPLPYEALTSEHYLYDLVYNPDITPFLREGLQRGARVQNGLKMLHLQAEAAWRIWNSLEE